MAKNKYEVHYVTIEKTIASTNVRGSVNGGGQVINGSGAMSVTGSTDTKHTTHIQAKGCAYEFSKMNGTYPFDVGDRMLFVCEHDPKTGFYVVRSLLNLENGTRDFYDVNAALWYCYKMTFFAALSMIIFVGFILFPWMLFGTIYNKKHFFKWMQEANDTVISASQTPSEEFASTLSKYSGRVVMEGKEIANWKI